MISSQTMERIRRRLAEILPLAGLQGPFDRLLATLPEQEGQALCFLYATAPISDVLDSPVEDFLDYARHGVFLYHRMPELRRLPEHLFLHYVLHHRANTEAMVPCRRFFYGQLAGPCGSLRGEEAALAVNYWCAAQASYCSTDDRTVSPLAVYTSAQGRCGEESAFAVHALRSVGIPARQVYAPYWSHCDDNHAWVEVYCGGRWQFLGACEPEEGLNRGWFVAAASRAMLVHSRVFGAEILPDPDGEVIDRVGCVTQLNQLERYANAKTLHIRLQTPGGEPVAAAVRLEVANYAALLPLAVLATDEQGTARLRVGRGTLHLSAHWNGMTAEQVVGAGAEHCTLVLREKMAPSTAWFPLDMTPPPETPREKSPLGGAQEEAGRKKLQACVSTRTRKIAAFCPQGLVAALAAHTDDPAPVAELLQKSRGNAPEIHRFLALSSLAAPFSLRIRLLRSLAEKDLTDCRAEVLADHLAHAERYSGCFPPGIYDRYLLCPRISTEQLSPWRASLPALLGAGRERVFRNDPPALWAYLCRTIRPAPALEYPALAISPTACLRTRIGGLRDKRILFVAACRALGVPARLHPCTGEPEYYRDGRFHFARQDLPCARLTLSDGGGTGWQYRRNWSLSRLEGHHSRVLGLEACAPPGTPALELEAGAFRLLTASRLPNGSIWAQTLTFSLREGEHREIALQGREVAAEHLLLDTPLPAFHLSDGGVPQDSCSLVRRPTALLWLRPGEEPTEHILNEVMEARAAFLGVELAAVLAGDGASSPAWQQVEAALPGLRILQDPGFRSAEVVARRMYLDPGTPPLLVIALPAKDGGIRAAYGSSGYQVGSADLLLKIMDLVKGGSHALLPGN